MNIRRSYRTESTEFLWQSGKKKLIVHSNVQLHGVELILFPFSMKSSHVPCPMRSDTNINVDENTRNQTLIGWK